MCFYYVIFTLDLALGGRLGEDDERSHRGAVFAWKAWREPWAPFAHFEKKKRW